MLKFTVLGCISYFGILALASQYLPSNEKLCSSITSKDNVDIQEIMGEWRLVLLFMDDGFEGYDDDSGCVNADFKINNSTSFTQTWYAKSMDFRYGGKLELPTQIIPSGDWIVTDPLGGHLTVKVVYAFPTSHLTLTFCGSHNDEFTHLWTIVVTRKATITEIDYLLLSSELLMHGYNIKNSKMITWTKC
ncbi:hypothetical protein C0J52_03697 [Blattella germanica]|nr:hypothetical protein C0J52_03697 [Blattella germanica]